jgi:DNA-binding CsgD family transcriptional regulator
LHALYSWTLVAPMTGERERAAAAVSEGLDLARRLGATCWLARFEVQMGRSLSGTGDDEGALPIGLSGLAHAREASDTCTLLHAAQLLQTMVPRYPEAAAALPPPLELLEMARSTHQTTIEAVLLPTFAVQAVAAGDITAAARWCRQGLELSGLDPSSFLAGYAAFAAVEIAAAKGDHELAARLHGRLLDTERLLHAAMQPHFVAAHNSAIEGIRNALGTKGFETQVAEGSTLPWPSTFRELEAYLRGIESAEPGAPAPRREARVQARPDGLTNRQLDVVRLLAGGLTNKEIASRLGVSPKTVMHHTVAIYQKIGVRGRSETVAWAIQTGVALAPG